MPTPPQNAGATNCVVTGTAWSLGNYLLFFQQDGNMVLYSNATGAYVPVWSMFSYLGTTAPGGSASQLCQQSDGNLVADTAASGGQAYWAANSANGNPTALMLDTGGNLWVGNPTGTASSAVVTLAPTPMSSFPVILYFKLVASNSSTPPVWFLPTCALCGHQVLVVGGGGSGGAARDDGNPRVSGGGGGGGIAIGSFIPTMSALYATGVGAGGAGSTSSPGTFCGGQSSFQGPYYSLVGGGGGGGASANSYWSNAEQPYSGGSGGGDDSQSDVGTCTPNGYNLVNCRSGLQPSISQANATTLLGNDGGGQGYTDAFSCRGSGCRFCASGGGGAGGGGSKASGSPNQCDGNGYSGQGGSGYTWVDGNTYAGGGGGGNYRYNQAIQTSPGGSGGGGAGATVAYGINNCAGGANATYYGSGGGGASAGNCNCGSNSCASGFMGAGGSGYQGIIAIRMWLTPTWLGTVGSGAPGFQGGYYSSYTQQSGSAWTYATCTAQCAVTPLCVAVIVQSSMSTAAATGTCWTVTTAQLTSTTTVTTNSGYTTYIGPTTTTACASPCTVLASVRALHSHPASRWKVAAQ